MCPGQVRNLSHDLWKMSWLTVLYLDNNQLSHLPAQISCMVNLEHLDASHNRLELLPPELGELVHLRELKLANNHIRNLPCELGKCFQIQTLGELCLIELLRYMMFGLFTKYDKAALLHGV